MADLHHVRIIHKTVVQDVEFEDLSVGEVVILYVNPLADRTVVASKMVDAMQRHGLTD